MMKTPHALTLSTDVAVALKEIIISSMPRKAQSISPMEVMMWIKLRSIAKKIHGKLFYAPKEISLSLSSSEELSLYEFLMNDEEETIISLDSALLNFIQTVDKKMKTNLFLTEKK